ncbi:hypothetical protein D3C80_387670 [compost metagenome]
MRKIAYFVTLVLLSSIELSAAGDMTIAHREIASGQIKWVSSSGDRSSTDALVDVGSLRQVGEVLEVVVRWPYLPAAYGPEPAEKNHIVCQAEKALSFDVEDGYLSPDGKYHVKKVHSPKSQREQAEQLASQFAKIGNGISSYGSDPRSMACWAAARKCAGQDFSWPPPPNTAPLVPATKPSASPGRQACRDR